MSKPIQILKLEKELGVDLWEVDDIKGVLHWKGLGYYYLNREGKVLGLSLRDCKLKDVSFLQDFLDLELLNLHGNDFIDYSILNHLERLEVLDLGGNKIQDYSFLKSLHNLHTLELNFNDLIDCTFLSEIKQIQNLDLSWNGEIQDYSFLKGLNELRSLNLSNNELVDISFLENAPQLQELQLNSNKIRDISILKNLKELRSLNMSWNKVEDCSIIVNNKNLKKLNLSNNSIQDFSSLESLNQLQELKLAYLNIQNIYFLNNLQELKSLNLSSNKIQDFSPLKNLLKLKSLNISSNHIVDISFLEEFHNLKILELNFNDIQEVSPILKLNQLQEISLCENEITEFTLKNFLSLSSIDLSKNPLQSISLENLPNIKELDLRHLELNRVFIKKMPNLLSLNLSGNKISDYTFLANLKHLKILNLYSNNINKLPILAELSQLEELSLANNELKNISFVKNLRNLKELSLGENQIQNISFLSNLKKLSKLYLGYNQIIDCSSLKHLPQLESLHLSKNRIIDYDFINYLPNLKSLCLSDNQIESCSFLEKPKKLKRLELSHNQIEDISPLNDLVHLESLLLDNNQIQEFPFSFLFRFKKLEILTLNNNPIKNIPIEIFNIKGSVFPDVKNYLEDLQKGKVKNKEVKLIFIGNGNVGKTQIAKRIVEQEQYKFDSQHKSTHAISILRKEMGERVLNIWDFAGQEIYHATHSLFMKTKALFVLVWDIENENRAFHKYQGKQYKNEKLSYWLEYARHFGQGSPILIVQNKVDTEIDREKKNLERLLDHYKEIYPIIEFIQISVKSDYNIDVFEYWIEEGLRKEEQTAGRLPEFIPLSWYNVFLKIRNLQGKHQKLLTVENFTQLCALEGIEKSTSTLLDYLHNTGVFFHRWDNFYDQIILNQSWIIEAIYSMLDRENFYFRKGKVKQGRLKYADLQAIWKNNNDEERELFIRFMISVELCFETTEKWEYEYKFLRDRSFIVPQLLPVKRPKEINFWETKRQIGQNKKVISYQFLPSIFIKRFIFRANQEASIEVINMWQHGIYLNWSNTYAVIEADYVNKQIIIKSNNPFLIEKIEEEIDIISTEGKIRPQLLQEADNILIFGEEYLKGFSDLSNKENILDLIRLGKLGKAIKQAIHFFKMTGNTEQCQRITLISSRFHTNENKHVNGLRSYHDYTTERNQIVMALQKILEEVSVS